MPDHESHDKMVLNGCGQSMKNSFLTDFRMLIVSGCRRTDISVKEGSYGKDH